VTKPRIKVCAKHGLSYDANRTDRCLVCRREAGESPTGAKSTAPLLRILPWAACAAVALGVAGWLYLRPRSPALASEVSAAQPKPAQQLAPAGNAKPQPLSASSPGAAPRLLEQSPEAAAAEVSAAPDAVKPIVELKQACQRDYFASSCQSFVAQRAATFAQLFQAISLPASFGAAVWTPYTINTAGVGFDCLRYSTRGLSKNASIVVALPKDRNIGWSPVRPVGTILQSQWQKDIDDDILIPPWPATYSATWTHGESLDVKDSLLCFSVFDGQPARVYAVVAGYDEAPPQTPDGVPIKLDYEINDLLAVGLQPKHLREETVQYALYNADVEAIKRMVARGASLESARTPSPLATALYTRWPLDQVALLLKGGAKPNAVGQGMTPLIALMSRLDQSQPHPESDHDVAEAARVLLAAGADPMIADPQRQTPLDLARKYRGTLTAAMLSAGGSAARRVQDENPELDKPSVEPSEGEAQPVAEPPSEPPVYVAPPSEAPPSEVLPSEPPNEAPPNEAPPSEAPPSEAQ